MNSAGCAQAVPANLGYRMPPEWHTHQSTWLCWPKNNDTWPSCLAQVQATFSEMVALLTNREQTDILVDDQESESQVRSQLQARHATVERVRFHLISTADVWIRDYGPGFLLCRSCDQAKLAFNHWGFNAWGNTYEELKVDAKIPEELESVLRVHRFQAPLVLEGGAIDVNGNGLCLSTEQCLLNPNRNPSQSKAEIEQCLKDFLGVEKILWLGQGLDRDDTNGHVDNVARFVNPETVVCAFEEDPAHDNYRALEDNYERLTAARDPNGRPLRIVPLPMPDVIDSPEGHLPASYANFYIANDVVLVPTFNHCNDGRALAILQALFPDRKVKGLDCRQVIRGLGALHCLTQQQPSST